MRVARATMLFAALVVAQISAPLHAAHAITTSAPHIDIDAQERVRCKRQNFVEPMSGSCLFLQRDPLGYEDSVNLYAGFRHDPVNNRDPTGLEVLILDEAPELPLIPGNTYVFPLAGGSGADSVDWAWIQVDSFGLQNSWNIRMMNDDAAYNLAKAEGDERVAHLLIASAQKHNRDFKALLATGLNPSDARRELYREHNEELAATIDAAASITVGSAGVVQGSMALARLGERGLAASRAAAASSAAIGTAAAAEERVVIRDVTGAVKSPRQRARRSRRKHSASPAPDFTKLARAKH